MLGFANQTLSSDLPCLSQEIFMVKWIWHSTYNLLQNIFGIYEVSQKSLTLLFGYFQQDNYKFEFFMTRLDWVHSSSLSFSFPFT